MGDDTTDDTGAPDVNEWNRQVIAEFRANGGKVGGPFEGAPMVLLHHIGAKSGTERVNPLMSHRDGDEVYIFASKAGAPDNPDWYHNLRADPRVTVEVGLEGGGIDTRQVEAVELTGEERDRVWEAHKANWPQFAGYEESTDRTVPVIALRS